MTRGKYAARAERKHEFAGLEERAVTAERERDRLAAELAEVRQHSEEKITGLRAQAAELRRQRDAAAAPRLTELEQANNRLRAERAAAAAELENERDKNLKFARRMAAHLRQHLGLTGIEAVELVDTLWNAPDAGLRQVENRGVASTDRGTVVALQRARGLRGAGDPAADAAPGIPAVVPLRRMMPDAAIPAYTYDGGSSAFAVIVGDDGSLRFYIEDPVPEVLHGSARATAVVPDSETRKMAQAIAARLRGVGAR